MNQNHVFQPTSYKRKPKIVSCELVLIKLVESWYRFYLMCVLIHIQEKEVRS